MIARRCDLSNYSIGGYKIAVRARSSKTLVVEGRDDRSVLQRIFLEAISGPPVGNQVRVDSSDIVKDSTLSKMGARDRVVRIIEVCRPPGGKLKGLKDREWDYFCTDNLLEISGEGGSEDIFVTRGHSIENYFFDSFLCCDFLKRKFSSIITSGFIVDVGEKFLKIIDFSFAYSMTCKRLELIDRLDRLISPSHIEFEGEFCLSDSFRSAMLSRNIGAGEVEKFYVEFASINAQFSVQDTTPQCRRWWSHGHLGEDALWACVGRVARLHGVNEKDAETICHGFREEKHQSSAHMMAINFKEEYSPLERVIEWALD